MSLAVVVVGFVFIANHKFHHESFNIETKLLMRVYAGVGTRKWTQNRVAGHSAEAELRTEDGRSAGGKIGCDSKDN